jgi:ADP-ribose pyrophosphatase YjhB (NUDIX family)
MVSSPAPLGPSTSDGTWEKYRAGVQWSVAIGDQRWVLTWSSGATAPSGTNHGSLGVCLADEGIVLVSRDGERWEFPAGRPERDESLLGTLRREVREEACAEVITSRVLGFTTSACVQGPEQGLVLVRSHWAARVRCDRWQPAHEITHRIEVPETDVMSVLTIEPGLEPMYEHIWSSARTALGLLRR